MPNSNLEAISRDIASEHTRFNSLMRAYADAMTASGATPSAVHAVMSLADEWGIEGATKAVLANPGHYGLKGPVQPASFQAVKPLLRAALESSRRLDELVASRETILRSETPSRPQVMVFQGREAALDLANGHVQWLDTGERSPLDIEIVEPKATRKRDKNRHLDRER